MALEVLLLEESDLADFVEADDAAMKDYPYAQAMTSDLPEGIDRKQLIQGEMKKFFRQDESNAWLKVIDLDSESQKMIAGALWQFQFEAAEPAKNESGTKSNEASTQPSSKVESGQSFMAAQAKRGASFKEKHIGAKPHASMRYQ